MTDALIACSFLINLGVLVALGVVLHRLHQETLPLRKELPRISSELVILASQFASLTQAADVSDPRERFIRLTPKLENPDLHEVMRREGSGWIHHGWVRKATPAWQRAYDTPGLALRNPEDNALVEGVQEMEA